MANHKSAIKRIRSNETKRLRNRYQLKSVRTLVKKLRTTNRKTEASTLLATVASELDKLAKKGVIHKNKGTNQKSRLARMVNRLP